MRKPSSGKVRECMSESFYIYEAQSKKENGLSADQREEFIAMLQLWTGWNRSAFEKLTDHELVELVDRHRMNRW